MKSERLKKLESEMEDLEQWKKLGLVPKKDIDKHEEEIRAIQAKIQEEKDRLRFMKESGDIEEYVAPKRSPSRQAYAEPHTLPDMDMGDMTDAGFDMETEGGFEAETQTGDEKEGGEGDTTVVEDDDEDDPFSDRNRWRRGILEDPDSDNW